jgi:hypothetical protein
MSRASCLCVDWASSNHCFAAISTSPAGARSAKACGKLGRGESPVDDAQLVRVVGDAELDVARPTTGGLAGEVRFDAQQIGVPAGRRRQVLCPQVLWCSFPRSTDDSFPHAVEMFLCARRALEFSHDPEAEIKRHSITSWARNRNASGIDLSFLLPIPSSGAC